MAVKLVCDGCAKETETLSCDKALQLPSGWFRRHEPSVKTVFVVCSFECAQKINEKTGVKAAVQT